MTKTERRRVFRRVRRYVALLRSKSPYLVGGVPISTTNRMILVRLFEAWLILTEDLMLRLELTEGQREVRLHNFVQAFLSSDLLDVLGFLEDCYHHLVGGDSDLETFKQFRDGSSMAASIVGGLLSPINVAVYGFLSEPVGSRKPDLLSLVAQFLRYPRKLELQSIGLEDQALDDYFDTELHLGSMDYDSPEAQKVIAALQRIIRNWFAKFRLRELLPVHGPGSVAEGPLTLGDKAKTMRVDALIRVLLSESGSIAPEGYFPRPVRDGLVRCSRTIFVPKTASKLRTISAEPATLQYLQQGVMFELYRFISQHPFLGGRIRLDDQEQNQIWAKVGSEYRNYGTIDLSKASDSVSWDLVRRLFCRSPRVFKWLLATRSRETLLPTGEVLRLKKFAPMGSALCFPIECILFGAVAELASCTIPVDRSKKFPPFWTVYGDDIIVHHDCYEECIRILQVLGFVVNREKSYNTGPYRESCGREYYDGSDITPLYYRTPFYSSRPSPGAYASWCSGANNAHYHHLPLYRQYLIDKVLGFSRRFGPYFASDGERSPYLWSSQPTNFHVKARWSRRYQRFEGRFLTVKVKNRLGEPSDDDIRYHMELVRLARRSLSTTCQVDESPPAWALRGSVEFFSSTTLPIVPFRPLVRLNRSHEEGTDD